MSRPTRHHREFSRSLEAIIILVGIIIMFSAALTLFNTWAASTSVHSARHPQQQQTTHLSLAKDTHLYLPPFVQEEEERRRSLQDVVATIAPNATAGPVTRPPTRVPAPSSSSSSPPLLPVSSSSPVQTSYSPQPLSSTNASSYVPSAVPSVAPSALFTTPPEVIVAPFIVMILEGIDRNWTNRDVTSFQTVTSEHVTSFWNTAQNSPIRVEMTDTHVVPGQVFSPQNVSGVETDVVVIVGSNVREVNDDVLNGEEVYQTAPLIPTPSTSSPSHTYTYTIGSPTNTTATSSLLRLGYNQTVIYSRLVPWIVNPVSDDVFSMPFLLDPVPYTQALQNITNNTGPISVASIAVSSTAPTPAPTPSPKSIAHNDKSIIIVTVVITVSSLILAGGCIMYQNRVTDEYNEGMMSLSDSISYTEDEFYRDSAIAVAAMAAAVPPAIPITTAPAQASALTTSTAPAFASLESSQHAIPQNQIHHHHHHHHHHRRHTTSAINGGNMSLATGTLQSQPPPALATASTLASALASASASSAPASTLASAALGLETNGTTESLEEIIGLPSSMTHPSSSVDVSEHGEANAPTAPPSTTQANASSTMPIPHRNSITSTTPTTDSTRDDNTSSSSSSHMLVLLPTTPPLSMQPPLPLPPQHQHHPPPPRTFSTNSNVSGHQQQPPLSVLLETPSSDELPPLAQSVGLRSSPVLTQGSAGVSRSGSGSGSGSGGGSNVDTNRITGRSGMSSASDYHPETGDHFSSATANTHSSSSYPWRSTALSSDIASVPVPIHTNDSSSSTSSPHWSSLQNYHHYHHQHPRHSITTTATSTTTATTTTTGSQFSPVFHPTVPLQQYPLPPPRPHPFESQNRQSSYEHDTQLNGFQLEIQDLDDYSVEDDDDSR